MLIMVLVKASSASDGCSRYIGIRYDADVDIFVYKLLTSQILILDHVHVIGHI